MIRFRVLTIGIRAISTVMPKFITVKAFFVGVSLSFKAPVIVLLVGHC